MEISAIVEKQRRYFAKGATVNLQFRLRALTRLQKEIRERTNEIEAALQQDLGKHPTESYMTEIGLVLDDIGFAIRHLRRWATPRPKHTPIVHFPSVSFVSPQPYGVVLVMSPWNYPFQLTVEPLVGAIAAGNCAVVKPSAYSPATSALLADICACCFSPGHVSVVQGGREENAALLEQRFDYIFFTGSAEVGKLVMEKAAANLTPVSLELGGKSPVYVDNTADIELAGRRIAFGKWLNAGQTCIAPDYVLAHKDIHDRLVQAVHIATLEFLGSEPLINPEYPKIVNHKHFLRLKGLLTGESIYFGGCDDGKERIAPTLLTGVSRDSAVMQEEIFGPILPVLTVGDAQEAIDFINSREKPLALYLFTQSRNVQNDVLTHCSFGGGCINDTIVHIATPYMPFGGVGHSGMGSYHGKKSYDTFTHYRSILKKVGKLDLPVRYHPYDSWKDALVRILLH